MGSPSWRNWMLLNPCLSSWSPVYPVQKQNNWRHTRVPYPQRNEPRNHLAAFLHDHSTTGIPRDCWVKGATCGQYGEKWGGELCFIQMKNVLPWTFKVALSWNCWNMFYLLFWNFSIHVPFQIPVYKRTHYQIFRIFAIFFVLVWIIF